MFGWRVWLGVACLAAACGRGTGADRPNGRPDAGEESDAGTTDGGILGAIGPLGETSWTPLFDDALSRFYRWMPSRGRDNDPQGIFAIDGGVLHVLGIPPTDEEQDFGYLATLADVGNYRARVEQKWGTNTFAPRLGQLRDSGLLYHLRGADQIWPKCIEFQIMEYNVGDLWMLAGTGVFAPVEDTSANEPTFDPLGTVKEYRTGRVIKSSDAESLTDWNSIELIASGRDSAQIVNGRWVNGASSIEADQGDGWSGLSHGHLALQAEGAEVFYRSFEVRPLAYLPPLPDAVVLFDGSNVDAWMGSDGGAPGWTVDGGVLEVVPFSGDLRTRESYGDVRLHLEFQVPATPTSEAHEDRGNSGVYLQGRYEVQILDSFGLDAGPVDCGAIYGVNPPEVNEAFPPGIWQSYDIVFRAPAWDGGTKVAPPRMTVVWNGSTVQQDVEVPGPTRLGDAEAPGDGPIRLQDHWNKVRYRNIWLQPLAPAAPDGGSDGDTDGGTDAGTGDADAGGG
jgi:Domain of Unknown Function (DUF1080)